MHAVRLCPGPFTLCTLVALAAALERLLFVNDGRYWWTDADSDVCQVCLGILAFLPAREITREFYQ